jgi:hypothetical protein
MIISLPLFSFTLLACPAIFNEGYQVWQALENAV